MEKLDQTRRPEPLASLDCMPALFSGPKTSVGVSIRSLVLRIEFFYTSFSSECAERMQTFIELALRVMIYLPVKVIKRLPDRT